MLRKIMILLALALISSDINAMGLTSNIRHSYENRQLNTTIKNFVDNQLRNKHDIVLPKEEVQVMLKYLSKDQYIREKLQEIMPNKTHSIQRLKAELIIGFANCFSEATKQVMAKFPNTGSVSTPEEERMRVAKIEQLLFEPSLADADGFDVQNIRNNFKERIEYFKSGMNTTIAKIYERVPSLREGARIKTARALLKTGASPDDVIQKTGLSESVVQRLKRIQR